MSSDAAAAQPVPEPSTDNTPAPPDELLAPVIPLHALAPGVVDQDSAAPAAMDSVPQISPLPTADVPVYFDDHVEYVYPNEVFAPAEVDVLLVHYTRTGRLPELGFSYREIALER